MIYSSAKTQTKWRGQVLQILSGNGWKFDTVNSIIHQGIRVRESSWNGRVGLPNPMPPFIDGGLSDTPRLAMLIELQPSPKHPGRASESSAAFFELMAAFTDTPPLVMLIEL